jgi:mono/diheme cytochrome c family protein
MPDRPDLVAATPATLAPNGDDTPSIPATEEHVPATLATSELPVFDATRPLLFSPVVRAQRNPPPLSGGTMAAADGHAVLSDPDRDLIYVVDVTTKSVNTLTLTPGDEPGRVVIAGTRAFVALRGSGTLATLDLSSGQLRTRTAVCAAPRGVFFDTSGSRVLVGCASGELVSLSADGSSVLATAQLQADLRDVGRDAQGLWATQFRSAALLRLDESLQLKSRQLPAAASVQGPNNLPPTAPRQFGPTLAYRTISSPTGAALMVHQRSQNTAVRPEPGGYGAGTAFGLCENGIVHTTVSRFTDAAVPEVSAALPQAVVPVDLSASPDGQTLAVVAPGNFTRQDVTPTEFFGPSPTQSSPAQQLYLFRGSALQRTFPATSMGQDPSDCMGTAGRWEHRFPGEATAVQFLDAKTLLVQVRNPAELHVFSFAGADDTRLRAVISLSDLAVRDTGHEVFHQNTGAGIACASCHGEALDDSHVWSFEFSGERRTQHLRGGVSKSAPFHWSGDLSSFDALIDDVYQKRMSAQVLPVDARAALTAWLDALPLVPVSSATSAAATRGQALFAAPDVGCASCHAGESLRSSGMHDVGTGGSFKVPSLHGLSLRLPLLHNGCADTLEKRFEPSCGGGDKHGTTSQLTPDQLADLTAYLRSL